jgi:TPR repeat protein
LKAAFLQGIKIARYSSRVSHIRLDAAYPKKIRYIMRDSIGLGGLPKDIGKARELYLLAASQGNPIGQAALGALYHRGDGVPKNDIYAVNWWRKAAEKQSLTALAWLGYAYHNGCGVQRDDAEAFKWYRSGADFGDSEALYNVGLAYYRGWKGINQDYGQAYIWFTLAVAREDRASEKAKMEVVLSEDKNHMTDHEIEVAEKAVKDWKPRAEPMLKYEEMQ